MTDPTPPKPEDTPEVPTPQAAPPPPPPEPPPAEPPPAAPPPPVAPVGSDFDPGEIENGKTFAILSYALSFVGLPFFLVPVITRDNGYTLYHAKQAMMVWLAAIALSVVSAILTVICIGPFVALAGGLFLLVLNVMGLLQTLNGEARPLPLIGPYAIDWFKGLTLVPKA